MIPPSSKAMAFSDPDLLPPASQIAIAYCPAEYRIQFELALALDHRLAQIVARTTEPMLGQMRLAWWRENFQVASLDRPKGDAVLDRISQLWMASSEPLIGLVDGWEMLLAEPPLTEAGAIAFAEGRAGALTASIGNADAGRVAAARSAARVWALADLAAKVSDPEERAMLVRIGLEQTASRQRLVPQARGLAVLGALGQRALKAGGRPLMAGRGAALTALRAAIFLR
jgi:15-cis-phytoene synthase